MSVVRRLSNRSKMSRGPFIVFEGCDRCGKTTQCKKVVESLKAEGIKAEMIAFPDRSTAIGQVINDYLERKCELEDHAVHLLFAANRWELMPRMQKAMEEGTTLVVDRYSYSGVAFTAAKPTMELAWCRQPEQGLMKPDAVLYFTLSAEEAAKRSEFGGERYEETNFQKRVAHNYTLLKEQDWTVIDANKTIDNLHTEVKAKVLSIMKEVNVKATAPGALWCQPTEVTQNGSADDLVSSNGIHASEIEEESGEPLIKKMKQNIIKNPEMNSQTSGAGDR